MTDKGVFSKENSIKQNPKSEDSEIWLQAWLKREKFRDDFAIFLAVKMMDETKNFRKLIPSPLRNGFQDAVRTLQ